MATDIKIRGIKSKSGKNKEKKKKSKKVQPRRHTQRASCIESQENTGIKRDVKHEMWVSRSACNTRLMSATEIERAKRAARAKHSIQ